MDCKIAGLISVAAVAAVSSTQVGAATDPDAALQANSFAELLQPIPNAVALLQRADSREASDATAAREMGGRQVAQYYYHHHHHHHHHHHGWWPWRRYYHHHHHHHHYYYYDR